MKKRLKIIGISMFLLGLFLLLINRVMQFTGSVIGNLYSTNITFLISLLLMIVGILVFETGKDNNLENIAEAESVRLSSPSLETEESELSRTQKEYIERNSPYYLKGDKPSWFYRLYRFLGKAKLRDVKGKDKVPEGPKLFIINHRIRYGEYQNLIASLDYPVHTFVGQNVGWSPFGWITRKIGGIPINATNSNLTEKQKKEFYDKAWFFERPFIKRFMKNADSPQYASNGRGIKAMTAQLMQGRSGVIMAEGYALPVNEGLKNVYAGYSLVAREYKRRTGKDLPIVPVGSYKGRVSFGDSFFIDEKGKQSRQELEELATQKIIPLYESLKK